MVFNSRQISTNINNFFSLFSSPRLFVNYFVLNVSHNRYDICIYKCVCIYICINVCVYVYMYKGVYVHGWWMDRKHFSIGLQFHS
jgi:hypothetical protein